MFVASQQTTKFKKASFFSLCWNFIKSGKQASNLYDLCLRDINLIKTPRR